jgi:CRP-like cAMP-binding protein
MQSHYKARSAAEDRNSSVLTREGDGSVCVSSQRASLAADTHGKPRRSGILKSGGGRASGIVVGSDGDTYPSVARARALSRLLGLEADQPQPQSQSHSHNHIQPRRSRLLSRIGTGSASTGTPTSLPSRPHAETLSLSVCSLGPGDMFGDDCLRDRITYTYTVKATQRAEVSRCR